MFTRNSFTLPPVDSGLILQATTAGSAVQRLSRRITLPGTGTLVHSFSTGDASYVPEGGRKPITGTQGNTINVVAEKFTTLIPITSEFAADSSALADAVYSAAPSKFASTFDKIVIGEIMKPAGMDNLDASPTLTLNTVADAYRALSAVDANSSATADGWLFTSAMFNELAGKVNQFGTPVFNFANGQFLGLPFEIVRSTQKAAYVGPFAARSVWGVVDGEPTVKVSTDATLIQDNGELISLFQENKIAILAEARFGFKIASNLEFIKLTTDGAYDFGGDGGAGESYM